MASRAHCMGIKGAGPETVTVQPLTVPLVGPFKVSCVPSITENLIYIAAEKYSHSKNRVVQLHEFSPVHLYR